MVMAIGAAVVLTEQRARAQEIVKLRVYNGLNKSVTVTIRATHPHQPGAGQHYSLSPAGVRGDTVTFDLASLDPFTIHVQDARGNDGLSKPVNLKQLIRQNPGSLLKIDPLFAGPPDGLMAAWSFGTKNGESSAADGRLEPTRRRR
jgi:hypothetical protein